MRFVEFEFDCNFTIEFKIEVDDPLKSEVAATFDKQV